MGTQVYGNLLFVAGELPFTLLGTGNTKTLYSIPHVGS